jgi:hypothetical protein
VKAVVQTVAEDIHRTDAQHPVFGANAAHEKICKGDDDSGICDDENFLF